MPARLPSRTWMRPTTAKTREALVATLQPYLEPESRGLDLFAGTGSLGLALLEAGCGQMTFVEADKRSLKFLYAAVEGKGRVVWGELPQALSKLSGLYDIVVADPPYNSPQGPATLRALLPYLAPGALVVFEYHHKEGYPQELEGLQLWKHKRFGETALTFWRRIQVEEEQDGRA